MGLTAALTGALNTAQTAVAFNSRQLDLVAQNIANADTPGYSRKLVSSSVLVDGGGDVTGIISSDILRTVDLQVQASYFRSLPDTGYAKQIQSYTDRLDDIFGTIEDQSSVSALASDLTMSLSALVNDPNAYAAQLEVISAAEQIAYELNSSYAEIQEMRQQADHQLALQADAVNDLLVNIQGVDKSIRDASQNGVSIANLLDERDRHVEQLSSYLDVNISDGQDNTVIITTNTGELLLADARIGRVSFTQTPSLQPGEAGNSVNVTTVGGATFDLLASSSSGSMVALGELRDDTLVKAQGQLDEIAAELSLAFSNVTVDSTAVTVGPDNGFELDISAFRAGNEIQISYVDAGGQTQNATLIGVTDPTLLPLANSETPRADDTVYGIDISSGTPATIIANIVAAINTPATDLQVSNSGADQLRVLGNTGSGVTVNSLSADVTVSASTDQGLGLNIFRDARDTERDFTDSLEGRGQRVGFAAAITVSSALKANSGQLVNYQTTPSANSPNDPARAQYLVDSLTNEAVIFKADAGIGTTGAPYRGTVLQYINQSVAYQGDQAQDAKTFAQSKIALTTNLAIRHEEAYAVNLDEEMAFLIEVENAYSANARVMKTIDELFDELLNTI